MTSGTLQKIAAMKKEGRKRNTGWRSKKESLDNTYARVRPKIRMGKMGTKSMLANTHCQLVSLLSSKERSSKRVRNEHMASSEIIRAE